MLRMGVAGVAALLLMVCSCGRDGPIAGMTAPAGMVDRSFHSAALEREVTYRVRVPARVNSGSVWVIYLLHGNGGTFREWSEDSRMAELAPKDAVLVMPEGGSSYWMNSATVARDRYEDFVTRDLVADAERGLTVRERDIAGNSMGGFAALVLGMKHPGMYGFVGAMSPPVDYPERGFAVKRWGQSMAIRAIFGPEGSATRRANDPFVLARATEPARVPYIFLSVGSEEPLLGVVRRFDGLLTERKIAHEFRVEAGGHDWGEWNLALATVVSAMAAHGKGRGE